MAEAICLKCGSIKDRALPPCHKCGLDPTSDPELLVKSIYLSTGRFVNQPDNDRWRRELDDVSAMIKAGHPPDYAQEDLTRLQAVMSASGALEHIRRHKPIGKFLLVAIPLFVVGNFIVAMIRGCN